MYVNHTQLSNSLPPFLLEMRYYLRLLSSPRDGLTLDVKHARLIQVLTSTTQPWRMSSEFPIWVPEEVAPIRDVDLSRCFDEGVFFLAQYVYRGSSSTLDRYHDELKITFEPAKRDYAAFIDQALKDILTGFKVKRMDSYAYKGYWELPKVERSLDSIVRFGPINYFTRDLCDAHLGKTPEEVAACLKGLAYRVQVFEEGVLMIASSEVMDAEAIELYNAAVRNRIGIEG